MGEFNYPDICWDRNSANIVFFILNDFKSPGHRSHASFTKQEVELDVYDSNKFMILIRHYSIARNYSN